MMSHWDPVSAHRSIAGWYQRFLISGLPLAPRYKGLTNALETALGQPGLYHRGPYLEISPPFRTDDISLRDAIARGTLHRDILKLVDAGALPERLYVHQADALARLTEKTPRSVVVATGTGSGKTECFLLPILNDLCSNPGPGVRAILIYPMNALVEDQLERWKRALACLDGKVTIGRFTGLTPEGSSNDAKPDPPYVLTTRRQMRQRPPTILITNYAMLEYMLERPGDSLIWQHKRALRWLVLDEAHTYTGALGLDVAMLLRRLKMKLEIGTGVIRAVATSASLPSNETEATSKAVSKLLGEIVRPEDIVTGENLEPAEWLARPAGDVQPDDLLRFEKLAAELDGICNSNGLIPIDRAMPILRLHRMVDDDLCRQRDKEFSGTDDPVGAMLYIALRGNAWVHWLMERLVHIDVPSGMISKRPQALADLVRTLDGTIESDRAERGLSALIRLGVRARPATDRAPLIPARYHAFFRGADGMHLCLGSHVRGEKPSFHGQNASDWKDRLVASRGSKCPTCDGFLLETAVCRGCGGLYLLGRCDSIIQDRFDLNGKHVATFLPKEEEERLLETEVVRSYRESHGNAPPWQSVRFDLVSGRKLQPQDASEHFIELLMLDSGSEELFKESERDNPLKKCLYCGWAPTHASVTWRLLSRPEFQVAALAEHLYEELPKESNGKAKLLLFSDRRQEAAYMAPLLEEIHKEHQRRWYWNRALEEEGGPMKGSTLAKRAFEIEHGEGTWDDGDGEGGTEAKQALANEIRGDAIDCLEQLGLAHWTPDEEMLRLVPPIPSLENLGLSTESQVAFVDMILLVLRRTGAFHLAGESVRNEWAKENPPIVFTRQKERLPKYDSRPFIRIENGPTATACVLRAQAFLEAAGAAHDPGTVIRVLSELWDRLKQSNVLGKLIRQVRLGANNPLFAAQIAGDAGRVRPGHAGWQCSKDGELFPLLRDALICPNSKCGGVLSQEIVLSQSYARDRALSNSPPDSLRVREHTAQLDIGYAREIQRDFQEGKIQILSCSTTFELGIDLGGLASVLMGNVPPTVSNYAQRAGRAGRRPGLPALVVTYCRPRVFDRAHFQDPIRLIAGTARAPIVHLGREIPMQRHMNALLWSSFLFDAVSEGRDAKNFKTIGSLMQGVEFCPAKAFLVWVRTNRATCLQLLSDLVNSTDEKGLPEADELLNRVLEEWSRICRRFDEEMGEYEDSIRKLTEKLAEETAPRGSPGAGLDAVRRQQQRFLNSEWIDYLGSHGFLPNYAFPTDVVQLKVKWEALEGIDPIGGEGSLRKVAEKLKLERPRHMALSEFSPGAEVVADGRVWTSDGLLRLPGKEPVRFWYRECRECGTLDHKPSKDTLLTKCPNCGGNLGRAYLCEEPDGFICKSAPKKVRKSRELAPPNAPAALIVSSPPEEGFEASLPGLLRTNVAMNKVLFINRGKPRTDDSSFLVCPDCGTSLGNSKAVQCPLCGYQSTQNTQGDGQNQYKFPLHLGHRFETETLRIRFDMPWAGSAKPHPLGGDLWQSLTAALEDAAADVLQIEPAAVGALVSAWIPYEDAKREVVLFDRTPGGSGIVRHLSAHLEELMERALQRLRGCSCQMACINCLVSFQRQQVVEKLNRFLAIGYLERLVSSIKGSKNDEPYNATPLSLSEPEVWLQEEITRDGISGRRRRQVLLALDGFEYAASGRTLRSWESVLLEISPVLCLSVSTTMLEGEDAAARSRRLFLQFLSERGAKIHARTNGALQWACILDVPSQDAARAIRFDGPPQLGGDSNTQLCVRATTVNTDAVHQLSKEWYDSAGELVDFAPLPNAAKDRLIEVAGGRNKTIADYFGPVVGGRIARAVRVEHTHLDSPRAIRRLVEFLGLLASDTSAVKTRIFTNSSGRDELPDRMVETIKKSLQALSGIEVIEVAFRPKRIIHDRRISITWLDGSETELLIGRGLDFIKENGEVLQTYIVVRE